jgi:hypothetical protein
MRKAYWRCNSGHYYSSLHCPFDGWTFDGCRELIAAVENVARRDETLSIEALALEGAPAQATKRTIIIEFGSSLAVFDAYSAEGYVINGEYKKVHELGHQHL